MILSKNDRAGWHYIAPVLDISQPDDIVEQPKKKRGRKRKVPLPQEVDEAPLLTSADLYFHSDHAAPPSPSAANNNSDDDVAVIYPEDLLEQDKEESATSSVSTYYLWIATSCL